MSATRPVYRIPPETARLLRETGHELRDGRWERPKGLPVPPLPANHDERN